MSNLVQDLSVIVLTYNQPKVLPECLDSILMQEVEGKQVRIFVIDDASTDETQNIILSYRDKYPDKIFPILYQSNQYQAGGAPEFPVIFNLKTDFLAFCDGDDYWIDKFKLAKQVAILESDESLSLVHTDYFLGKIVSGHFQLEERTLGAREKAKGVKFGSDMVKGNEIKKSTALFRFNNIDISFLQKCHGVLAQDWLVAVSAALHGDIRYIDEQTSVYRVSEKASFQSLDQVARNKVKEVVRWACAANLPEGEVRNSFREYLFKEQLRRKITSTVVYRSVRPLIQVLRYIRKKIRN